MAGVSIGKVEDVEFLPADTPNGERIEATLVVVEKLDNKPVNELIRTDSTAQLVATSILGNDKMINITPGSSKGSAVDENTLLASSAGNSLNDLTLTGNELLKKMDRLSEPAGEILNKANSGEGTLGKIINDDALTKPRRSGDETRANDDRLQSTIESINRGEGSAGSDQ